MELSLHQGRKMMDFLPAWVVASGTTAGGVLGSILITRSVAKKKLSNAIGSAQTQLSESNSNMIAAQAAELCQLRTDVQNLRKSVDSLTNVNISYVQMLQEREAAIAQLHSDCRIKDELIRHLEAQVALPKT